MDITLNRIQQQLKLHNMNKIQLLTSIGLTKSAWSSWVRGETTTYKDHIAEIAAIFNVSADYLLGIEQKNKPSDQESLTQKEKILIDAFRRMTDSEKDMLLRVAAVKSAEIDKSKNQ